MPRYLADIVAAHRRAAAEDHRDPGELVARALAAPAPASFAGALARSGGLAVIAEVKRRSPSKGDLAPDLDPASVATEYASGGAACLSVLTDEAYFGGRDADVAAAVQATGLPVLRKDFTVSANDVADTRLLGASAVLLIAAALSDDELASFHALAGRLGLDALVEVHSEEELDRALALEAPLVGVNRRDLATFAVDRALAEHLAARIPPGVMAVAESGIAGADDAASLAAAGYRAVLVGESVVTAGDRAAAVRALAGHAVGIRGPAGDRATGACR